MNNFFSLPIVQFFLQLLNTDIWYCNEEPEPVFMWMYYLALFVSLNYTVAHESDVEVDLFIMLLADF